MPDVGVRNTIPVTDTPASPDLGEFESDMTRWLRDPVFRQAYERATRRMRMSITPKLPVDGTEYHRRQLARRRRGH